MTSHRHLPSDLCVRTLAGHERPGVAATRLIDCLASACPECRRTLERSAGGRDRLAAALQALDRSGELDALSAAADPPALDAPMGALAEEVARLRRERRRWKLDLWELRRLPRSRRGERVEDARSRFSSAGLAELLTATSGELLTADPREAASLAALVPAVLARVPREETEAWAQTLILRAAARRADALRRAGDPARGERVFRKVRALLATHPDAPSDLVAEAAAREAYLHAELGRPAAAEDLLSRAELRFRDARDRIGAEAAALRRGLLELTLGRHREALETFDRVTARLLPDDPPELWIGAVAGSVAGLCATGRGEDAERRLASHVETFESAGELLAGAFYRALEAQVHAARGRTDRAAAALAACRTAHRTLGRPYAGLLPAIRRMVEEVPLPSAGTADPRAYLRGSETRDGDDDRPAHLELDVCLAVSRGELHPAALLRRAHDHLIERCPGCRAEWDAARVAEPAGELFSGPPALRALPSDPRRLLARDVEVREALLSRLRLERRRAREDLAVLLADPPWERPVRLEVARTRFASPALAELLVEAARRALPGDPREAASLAELVAEVLDHVPGADAAWWRELATRGGAELDRARAALALERGSTREAEAALERAVEGFGEVGDGDGERRALPELARLARARGGPGEALRPLERAAALRDPEAEPAVRLEILVARAGCLCDLGRHDEAGTLLDGHPDLVAEAADVETLAILCGLRGRVERALGRPERAAEAYEASRRGRLVTDRPFEALLATFDLARLHLPPDRDRELARLAAGTVPVGPDAGTAAAPTLTAFALSSDRAAP